jgi:hypothetical protein
MSFSEKLNPFRNSWLRNKKIGNNAYWMYFILIRFIPNYSTCFHKILKTKSSKHMKKFTIY